MSCSNCACFYKCRIFFLVLISFGETVFGFYRFYVYASPNSSIGLHFNITNLPNLTDPITLPFILDGASLLTSILLSSLIVLILLLLHVFCLCAFIYSCQRLGSGRHGNYCCLCGNKIQALYRLVSLDCNCPCYRARPKLRFRLRFVLLILCFLLRGTAAYFYWTLAKNDEHIWIIFYVCLISIAFLIGRFLLDLYHFSVWWCYTPSIDTTCCRRSPKHKRYIPYHLVGDNQRKDTLGDRPCTTTPCKDRHLSHIAVFHGENYQPQPRWSLIARHNSKANYIGFHITRPDSAVSIVHSEFRCSSQGMLGKGVYFARSIDAALGKTRGGMGAYIIAEIRMGKVFEFEKEEVYPLHSARQPNRALQAFITSSEWHKNYDTCYMNHQDNCKDEFCIKDPKKQIIKWIVVIQEQYDSKVSDYGLDSEFDSTQCFCV